MISEEEWQKAMNAKAHLICGAHAPYCKDMAEWVRKNPPPETLALVEALRIVAKEHKVHGSDIYPTHNAKWAMEALAEFERKSGRGAP